MIKLVRSLFGLGNSPDSRTVVENPAAFDLKEVQYIRDSNTRLNLLNNLLCRYKGTAQEDKIKAVYDKTKNIHTYLVSKKRVHELELFHIQHTDHFLNTFTVIIDVHQINKENSGIPGSAVVKAGPHSPASGSGNIKSHREAAGTAPPCLAVPAIAIDTYARIVYVKVDTDGNPVSNEISFTSTQQEKETFLTAMAARLGIYRPDIAYVGNAQVILPDSNGSQHTEIVPILNWKSLTYALYLNDYRLFPVQLYRQNS